MSRARPVLVLFALLVASQGLLAPDNASALVERVTLVEEFGYFT